VRVRSSIEVNESESDDFTFFSSESHSFIQFKRLKVFTTQATHDTSAEACQPRMDLHPACLIVPLHDLKKFKRFKVIRFKVQKVECIPFSLEHF
jgi:hypothetical protein